MCPLPVIHVSLRYQQVCVVRMGGQGRGQGVLCGLEVVATDKRHDSTRDNDRVGSIFAKQVLVKRDGLLDIAAIQRGFRFIRRNIVRDRAGRFGRGEGRAHARREE